MTKNCLEVRIFPLVGAPGSGKGTQGRLLSENFRCPVIGMGDLLRAEIQQNTEVGKAIKETVGKGKFPRVDIVMGVLWRHMENIKNDLVIWDGMPRSLEQAEKVDEDLETLNKQGKVRYRIHKVIYLEADPDLLKSRMAQRFVCARCQAVYSYRIYKEARKDFTCQFCAGKEIHHREDDEESVIQERLKDYKEKISPLLDYYQDKSLLYRVKASGDIASVFQELCQLISS